MDRIKIANGRYLFSVLLNYKSHFLFVYLERVSYQVIHFNDVKCDHKEKKSLFFYDVWNFRCRFQKKKKVLNDCFQKQCSRHYDNFVILVNKNAKKRKNFICNFLFDWCLESIYLQKITVWEMSCFFSIELLLWLRWRMKYYLCFLL